MVLICPSDIADASVRIYNMDGTDGGVGGNALRCVGKYLYDNNCPEKTISRQTAQCAPCVFTGGRVSAVTCDMGIRAHRRKSPV